VSAAGSVFIVDDNPHNLGLLASILRSAGYEVRMAQSARRALAALASAAEAPELMMLDINMPELNGIELCKQLKADARLADVPVIFLSALDDVNDKLSAFSAGGVDYVTKPFHNDEVLARVATQLKLARLRRELEQKNRELAEAWRNADHVFTAMAEVLPGTILDGKYALEHKIGVGGFSAIYRGRHLELQRAVAIKILRPEPNADRATYLARFRHEGFSTARVVHPNAVAVLDSGVTASGVAYLVMELLEGRSLAEELAAVGPLPLLRCAAILDAVCAVLAHAHASGILHRDIKPANIFLHRGGGGETVKVVDFGIAKLFDDARAVDALTTIGRLIGTPVYMSPERLLGKAHDERSDTYGVAMTLYQMISGRLPFDVEGENLGSVVMTCLGETPAPLRRHVPEAPAALDELLARGLARRPDARPSVTELAGQFRRILEAIGAHDGSLGDVVLPLDQPLAHTVEVIR
jgi:CheY-like chemotaxis protein